MHFSTKWDVPFHDSACHNMDFVHEIMILCILFTYFVIHGQNYT